ncbi:hypothetical protein SPFM8_00093 [Salmonella phage SPFM8]|nr:hypothetical protein SPFM8_00093 [Salmonella phage SPFM8]
MLTETLKVVDSDAGRAWYELIIPIYLDGVAPGRSAELFKFHAWVVGQHQSQPYEEIKTGYSVNWISDELTVNTTLVGSAAVEQPKRLVFFYVNGDSIMADKRNPNNTIFTGTTALDLAGSEEALPRSWEQLEAWFALPIADLMEEEVEGFLEYPRLVKWFIIDDMVTCQKANRQDTKLRIRLPSFFVEEGLNMNEITLIRCKVPIISLMHMGL